MAAPGIDGKQAGLWVPPGAPFCFQGAVTAIANRGSMTRFPCPRSMTITKIAFFVTNAASVDDSVDVGLYSGDANPVVLLGSSGSKNGLLNSTGLKTVPLSAPVSLVQGRIYYAALGQSTPGGTSAAVQGLAANQSLTTMFGSTPPTAECGFTTTGFPLPASVSIAPVSSFPIFALLQ